MKKILIVDDEPDILEMVGILLEHAGYAVLKSQEGREAVQLARKEKPDLIILDIKMPEIDGDKVTDLLQAFKETRDIPIIYFSSLLKEKDIKDGHVKGSKIGNQHFLSKMSDTDEILKQVKKVLEE